jgi:hypothetical protein
MAPGLAAFVDAVIAGRCPRCQAVKGPVHGPITLAGLLRIEGEPAIRHPQVVAALARFLAHRARAQADLLATCGLPVLLSIDEPGVAVADLLAIEPDAVASVIGTVIDGARSAGALAQGARASRSRSRSLSADLLPG